MQVVHIDYSTENGFNTNGAFQTSGLSLGIYPIYASSRLLIDITIAGIFQHPTANSYTNWRLVHSQSGDVVSGNNIAYALSYLGGAGDGNYRGDNASNTFYPASYGTTGIVSFTLQACPINGTVQFNRDSSSTSTITITEIKQ